MVIVQDRTWLSLIGFTSGVLVSIANVLQFLGGQAAGDVLSLPFLQLTDNVIGSKSGMEAFCVSACAGYKTHALALLENHMSSARGKPSS